MNNCVCHGVKQYDGNNCLKKDWIFPYTQIPKGATIIIYGAGDVGQSYYAQLSLNEYCKILHWVDLNYQDYQGFGLCVESTDVIKTSNYDYIVLAVCDSSKACEVNECLIGNGVEQDKIVWNSEERYVYRGNIERKRLWEPAVNCAKRVLQQRGINTEFGYGKEYIRFIDEKSKKGLVIPRLVVELTTACTLKCKYCNNLIPQLKPRNVGLERVREDILNISKAVDEIIILELIGGEPFLYPQLNDVLKTVLELNNVFEVEITTNGTIVPGRELVEKLKNPKVVVHISCYDSSNRVFELEKLFFDNRIRYVHMNELEWVDSGGVESRNRSKAQIQSEYWRCLPSYTCKTLFDGKIYACARSASLYEMGVLNDGDGFVVIDNRESLRNDLRDFWLRISDEACNHCDAAEIWKIIKAGEQIDEKSIIKSI